MIVVDCPVRLIVTSNLILIIDIKNINLFCNKEESLRSIVLIDRAIDNDQLVLSWSLTSAQYVVGHHRPQKMDVSALKLGKEYANSPGHPKRRKFSCFGFSSCLLNWDCSNGPVTLFLRITRISSELCFRGAVNCVINFYYSPPFLCDI